MALTLLCLEPTSGTGQNTSRDSAKPSEACLAAAKAKLGASAVVLQCGRLGSSGSLEVLAAEKLRSVSAPKDCTPVSRFAILALRNSSWKVELEGAKEFKNPEGYVATDYIDDSPELPRWCLQTSTQRSDGKLVFTVFLNYLNPKEEIEGSPTEISWNDKVGRYQEFNGDEFLREIKNLPHRGRGRNK